MSLHISSFSNLDDHYLFFLSTTCFHFFHLLYFNLHSYFLQRLLPLSPSFNPFIIMLLLLSLISYLFSDLLIFSFHSSISPFRLPLFPVFLLPSHVDFLSFFPRYLYLFCFSFHFLNSFPKLFPLFLLSLFPSPHLLPQFLHFVSHRLFLPLHHFSYFFPHLFLQFFQPIPSVIIRFLFLQQSYCLITFLKYILFLLHIHPHILP